jgi:hypothetical protein
MLRNTKGVEEVYPNRPLLGLGSITGAIYEAKMCAYLIGLKVGLRWEHHARTSMICYLILENPWSRGDFERSETRGFKIKNAVFSGVPYKKARTR